MVRKPIRKYAGLVCFFVSLLALAFPSRANENQTAFNEFKDIMINKYILYEYHSDLVNSLLNKYEPQLVNASSIGNFANMLNECLKELKTGHMWVYYPENSQFLSYINPNAKVNYDLRAIPAIVKDLKEINPVFSKGQVGSVGYLLIKQWYYTPFDDTTPAEILYFSQISKAVEEFQKNTTGLIIDIRSNPGGSSNNTRTVAQHFVREPSITFYMDYYHELNLRRKKNVLAP